MREHLERARQQVRSMGDGREEEPDRRRAKAQERAAQAGKSTKRRPRLDKDADTAALEKRLSDALGLVVTLDHRGQGGELRIRYRSLEQLDGVVRRLEGGD